MSKRIGLFIFLLTFSLQLSAQTGATELQDQLKRSEQALNELLEKFKKKLGPVDKAALIKSQEDWLRFRASNAKFKSRERSQNIILSDIARTGCQIEMTEARIAELEEVIGDF